ncbi:MAG: SoxR reducing system RseC family protein [Woeseiaceae bacterium]
MENPRGRVIAVNSGETQPQALVEIDAIVQCARCAEGRGCGAGLLGSPPGSRRIEALVSTGLTIGAGDEVRIELAPSDLLRASLIVYGTPLFGAVVGALAAYAIGLGDLHAVLAAMAGIVSGLLLARTRLRKSGCLRRFTPTVVERISSTQSPASLR